MRHYLARTAMGCVALGCLALSGCNRDPQPPEPEPQETETPSVEPTQSIFAPEAGITPVPEMLEPLKTSVGFEEGGTELSEKARAELATVLASPQNKAGGAIVLRGHSDSGGSDDVNLRASQARAEAVREWLVEQGIDEDRIAIIVFGEQNPIEPNALPDGTPNEEGRAANRRVEISIAGDETEPVTPAGEEAEAEEAR